MPASDDEFRHESAQDPRSIVKYLQALTAGIERGHLHLGIADHQLELEPGGMIGLEIRARRKGARVKLSLELSWREGEELEQAPNTLTISVDG